MVTKCKGDSVQHFFSAMGVCYVCGMSKLDVMNGAAPQNWGDDGRTALDVLEESRARLSIAKAAEADRESLMLFANFHDGGGIAQANTNTLLALPITGLPDFTVGDPYKMQERIDAWMSVWLPLARKAVDRHRVNHCCEPKAIRFEQHTKPLVSRIAVVGDDDNSTTEWEQHPMNALMDADATSLLAGFSNSDAARLLPRTMDNARKAIGSTRPDGVFVDMTQAPTTQRLLAQARAGNVRWLPPASPPPGDTVAEEETPCPHG